jgi:hypothetical protein
MTNKQENVNSCKSQLIWRLSVKARAQRLAKKSKSRRSGNAVRIFIQRVEVSDESLSSGG